MNILFCNSSNVSELKGGTERITARISCGLVKLGHKCFLAYKTEIDPSLPLTKFEKSINVNNSSLESFILDNCIDVVIIQKMTRDVKLFSEIRKRHDLKYKIISVLHFNPGYEEISATFKSFYSGLFSYTSLKEYAKDVVRTVSYPIYKLFYPFRNKELYRTVYEYSDKVVLLSKSFIQEYSKYCGVTDFSKFEVIPNALSFDEYLPESQIEKKKNEVLVVSRLVEIPKKISLAIRIWAEIEKEKSLDGWNLKIVGDGPDREKYEEMVNRLQLKRVEFCGRQNPKTYYKDSRIFLMTSEIEGWGLTLTEAQQFGCVPLAFKTYSSVYDIIENNFNGYIIEKNEIDTYVSKLKQLMIEKNKCRHFAECALRSCKQFDLNLVVGKWNTLISE